MTMTKIAKNTYQMKEKVLETFRELGFDVEDFGDDDYMVMRDQRWFIYSYGYNEE